MPILLKRANERPDRSDGYRILVDRLWPRGVSRRELGLDIWAKTVAPSTKLRKWFDHDAAKWAEFKKRYFRELDGCGDAIEPILALLSRATVTLVYAAKNTRINQAVALKEYIESRIASDARGMKHEPDARGSATSLSARELRG